MAKVLRSNVKHGGEVIPAGTPMSSKKFPNKLRKQLQETGFFVDQAETEKEEVEGEEEVKEEDEG